MGGLFAALGIGISGMQAHQIAMRITGQNIANVNTEGYSRQRADLIGRDPVNLGYIGAIGRGVDVGDIIQMRDEFLDVLYRTENSHLWQSRTERNYLARVEDAFLEPSDVGLSTLLDGFFTSLQDLATNPESQPIRAAVVASARTLVDSFRGVTDRLDDLRTDANNAIKDQVGQINNLSEQIADLNRRIVDFESGTAKANDLRDRRAYLLDQLSRITAITVTEDKAGAVTVETGGMDIVRGVFYDDIEAVVDPSLDPIRNDFVKIVHSRSGTDMTITGGELYGLLNVRDNTLPTIETDLNDLANTLIAEFNKIHSQGNGLNGFTSLTSDNFVLAGTEGNDLDDPATGLAFTPVDGSFEINVIDATGAVATTTITVDLDGVGADDSLNDLAANLNAVADISASVSNGRLVITADPTYSFTFSNDSSNVLQVLGLNTFFSGSNASNIDVNSVVENDLTLIAASLSTDPLDTGNNENALNLAGLQQGLVMESGIATLGDSLNATVSNIGNVANRLDLEAQTQDLFVREMNSRRQEVSGVDLNEEAANLIRFQRGFEAAARLITVTDAMLEAIIRM